MTDPTARIAVIGGGIAGASAAFGLAFRGAAVTLIDDVGAGQATAASAGIIAPWTSTSTGAYYDTYAAGGAFYPELLARLADLGIPDVGYRRSGALVVHRDPRILAEAAVTIRERVTAAGAVAGKVHDIDAAGLREAFPPIAPDLAGLRVTGGGRVDGRTLRDALIAAARTLGARLVRDRVAELSPTRSGTWTVGTASAREDVDAVVVAGGAWSPGLLSGLGLGVDLTAQRGQLVHVRVDGEATAHWPTVHPLAHHYIAPFDGGRVVIGATREDGVGFDVRATVAGQRQVLDDALAIAPGLAAATVVETRVGIRPMSTRRDGLPIVGEVPGRPGLWLASGFGAGGLTMGPLIGDALARDLLGEAAPEIAHLGL